MMVKKEIAFVKTWREISLSYKAPPTQSIKKPAAQDAALKRPLPNSAKLEPNHIFSSAPLYEA
jgi:hypothetical protein